MREFVKHALKNTVIENIVLNLHLEKFKFIIVENNNNANTNTTISSIEKSIK